MQGGGSVLYPLSGMEKKLALNRMVDFRIRHALIR